MVKFIIHWGDGTPAQEILLGDVPADRQIPHTFATAGAPTITIDIVDEDGQFNSVGSKLLTVTPPPEVIVVAAGGDGIGTEATLFTRTVTFTDPGDQGAGGRDVTVSWGDGTTAQSFRIPADQFSFDISHTFTDNRATPYTVTVTVNDDGAQQDSDSFNIAVADVAPTIPLVGSATVAEGAVYTLTLGDVVDPGADTVSQYIVRWGDGNDQTLPVDTLPANRQVQHVFNDGDIGGTLRTIRVDIVNEDGTFLAAGQKAVTVTDCLLYTSRCV